MSKLKIEALLRKLVLENEGDRDDIYSDVLNFIKPIFSESIGLLEKVSKIKDYEDHHDLAVDAAELSEKADYLINQIKGNE